MPFYLLDTIHLLNTKKNEKKEKKKKKDTNNENVAGKVTLLIPIYLRTIVKIYLPKYFMAGSFLESTWKFSITFIIYI